MLREKLAIMKKTIILILFVVFCMVHQGLAQPLLMVDHPVFTFESVPEGVHVTHDFIIQNKGDSLLKIDKVLPP